MTREELEAKVAAGENLQGIDLSEADLNGVHLSMADLDHRDLDDADLRWDPRYHGLDDDELACVLGRADLSNADLSGADSSTPAPMRRPIRKRRKSVICKGHAAVGIL